MENRKVNWLIGVLIILGIAVGIGLAIYVDKKDGISEMNTINTLKLSEEETVENVNEEQIINKVVETSNVNMKVSPNAIIIEKRYYKGCDHLIREVLDVPEELVNKSEEEIKKEYETWKIEGYSPTEIVVYKEFEGICNEHYVIKEHDGVIGIFFQNNDGIEEWIEDTEIAMQYLPEQDIENLKAGIKVVGKMNLSSCLENYE